MYHTMGSTMMMGGGVAAAGLAFTGFSAAFFLALGVLFVLLGLLLVRAASLRRVRSGA